MPTSSSSSSSSSAHAPAAAGFEVLRVESEAEREDQALARWLADATTARRTTGVRLESHVRNNRNFRNPAILQKMIEYCEIDEHATALPRRHNQPTATAHCLASPRVARSG